MTARVGPSSRSRGRIPFVATFWGYPVVTVWLVVAGFGRLRFFQVFPFGLSCDV